MMKIRSNTAGALRSLCLTAAAAATSTSSKNCCFVVSRRLLSTGIAAPWHLHSSVHIPCETIEQTTMSWIQRVVIGWNLCPFADHPYKSNQLDIRVIRGTDDDTVMAFLLDEAFTRENHPGTTLVVAPECHPHDFERFLDMVAAAEIFLEEKQLGQQIAPFHPLFEFGDDVSEGGVGAYTNRSPYPTFHLLREVEVTKAVNKLNGDASIVWQRNVNLLEDLRQEVGGNGVDALVVGRDTTIEQESVLQELLKKHRLRMGGVIIQEGDEEM
jgi:uncharacterized protein